MSEIFLPGLWLAFGTLAIAAPPPGLSTEVPVSCVKEDDCPNQETLLPANHSTERFFLKATFT